MRRLVGPRPDDEGAAVQAAVAAFTRYGFEAAAITALALAASALPLLRERGLQRGAKLRFDHPYAALAVPREEALPLFTAWVDEPIEPEPDPA